MNALCVWDFTVSKKFITQEVIDKNMRRWGKKWCFQEEIGKDGYEHFQGRVSLKTKSRLSGVRKILEKAHWGATSSANKDNMFYVMKEDTRVAGPWANTDEVCYIPRQIRELPELYPWQAEVIERSKVWDTRHINVIIDTTGNIGKSTLVSYMRVHKLARTLPPMKSYKDIMRCAMSMPVAKTYIVDMPRAICKKNLGDFFSGIESLKSGYCWDDRYAFKERNFDCPNIWLFTNKIPESWMLTADRWCLWEITHDRNLVCFKEKTGEKTLRCNTTSPLINNFNLPAQLAQNSDISVDSVDAILSGYHAVVLTDALAVARDDSGALEDIIGHEVTSAGLPPNGPNGPALRCHVTSFPEKIIAKKILPKLGNANSHRLLKDSDILDLNLDIDGASIDAGDASYYDMPVDDIVGISYGTALEGVFTEYAWHGEPLLDGESLCDGY